MNTKRSQITLTIFLLFFVAFATNAQEAKVCGKITAFNDLPVNKVKITVKRTGKTALTDKQGNFCINCVKKEKITIIAEGFKKTNLGFCRFRPKPATHSGSNLPLIPGQTCHPFRWIVYHFSGHFRNH